MNRRIHEKRIPPHKEGASGSHKRGLQEGLCWVAATVAVYIGLVLLRIWLMRWGG